MEDLRVEPDASHDREHFVVHVTDVDAAAAGLDCELHPRVGSSGKPTFDASRYPVPAGRTASAVSVPATACTHARTVPSGRRRGPPRRRQPPPAEL